jgi:hypothetical protein
VRGWSVWYGLGVLLILLAHVVMDTPAPLWGPHVLVWATTILLWYLGYRWRAGGDGASCCIALDTQLQRSIRRPAAVLGHVAPTFSHPF